jgi:hypothetical protein
MDRNNLTGDGILGHWATYGQDVGSAIQTACLGHRSVPTFSRMARARVAYKVAGSRPVPRWRGDALRRAGHVLAVLSQDGGLPEPHRDRREMNDAQEMRPSVTRRHGALSVCCSLCKQPTLGVLNDGRGSSRRLREPRLRCLRFGPAGHPAHHSARRQLVLLPRRAVALPVLAGVSTGSQDAQFVSSATAPDDFKRHIPRS